MNLNNNSLTTPNSIDSKRIYEPYLKTSLNYPINPLPSQKFYPKSNIPLFKKYSLFVKNRSNNDTTLSNSNSKKITNMSHVDFHTKGNKRIIKEYNYKKNIIGVKNKYKKGKISINNSIEKDLDMMKLQMSCDLVTHKINQIKNKVQDLHENSLKDDKNLINKNKEINFYKKNSSNINYTSPFSHDINKTNSNLNNEINTYNNKRHIFMDFSKLENKKFLKISNEMSREINNTFDRKKFNNMNDTFMNINQNISNSNINKDEKNNQNIKLSNKINFKYFLLNNQYNDKLNINNNKLYTDSNLYTSSYSKDLNNNKNNNNDTFKNNNEIRPYNVTHKIKLNNFVKLESNTNKNYFKLPNKEKNNKNIFSNKKIITDNKIKENMKKNNKEDFNNSNNHKNKNDNIMTYNNPKFGFLDKYFINKDYNHNNDINIKEKNLDNLDNNAYKYKKVKINKNRKEEKIKNAKNIKNIGDNDNIKIEETNEDDDKLLLYSNLERSKQDNFNWNKINKGKIIKNNKYIKVQNNFAKGNYIISRELNTNIKVNNNNKNYKVTYNKNIINNNKPVSYAYLIDQKLKESINNNKNNINKNNILSSNITTIQNKNAKSNHENIKDNNFKININNISNYSIKNNCLNINNSMNQNQNKNDNNIEKEKENKNNIDNVYLDEKENENMKLNHNYSKDDLIMNSEKINFENINKNTESEEKENTYNFKNNNKRNITFENDEIILDPITEEEYRKRKVNPIGRKNIVIRPYNLRLYNKRKNNDKKIRIKHKELCHKFTDNPQHFFTVQLNEMMLRALNINKETNKGKQGKK